MKMCPNKSRTSLEMEVKRRQNLSGSFSLSQHRSLFTLTSCQSQSRTEGKRIRLDAAVIPQRRGLARG